MECYTKSMKMMIWCWLFKVILVWVIDYCIFEIVVVGIIIIIHRGFVIETEDCEMYIAVVTQYGITYML